ncbi:MAG: HzsA-related protein [Pirellulaceae bacterium]
MVDITPFSVHQDMIHMHTDPLFGAGRLSECPSRPGPFWMMCLLLLASVRGASAQEEREAQRVNLALTASITASSVHSPQYVGQLVADGAIPPAMSQADVGRTWCAQGNNHPQGVTLTFHWAEPVQISELVYFGRTAFQWEENWKDYEVYVEAGKKPVTEGQLQPGHGPQRISLPEQITVSSLTLKFLTSYGGSNPGAAEIQAFADRLPDSAYAAFTPPAPVAAPVVRPIVESALPESAELARQLASGELGFTQLIVVQRHEFEPSHVYTYHVEGQRPGGGLYAVDLSNGEPSLTRLVDASDGLVLDANVSYDGRTVLFSWKRTMQDKLQLFTINVDGTQLTQLTSHDSNNLNACWLPDDSIAFLSDRKPAFAYCWTSSTPILYCCDRNGGNVKRLSANYLNDFTPSVMEDGRIIYSRWEYVDRPAIPIQSLWSINPDGTGLSGYFGNRVLSPATFMESHEIPGTGKVLCVLTSHNGPCRGAIGMIDPALGANSQEAIRNLTPEVDMGLVAQGDGNHIRGPYESPFPIDGSHFLMSCAGTIVLRDYEGTEQVTILPRQQPLRFYTARPVMARVRPALRSSNYQASDDGWASVLVEDVYKGLESCRESDRIVQIAVVQEMEKSKFADVSRRAFGFQFPVVSCGATYAPKKVWGFARVEADGSAHFKVPAQVPIYFMAMDEFGRAVQRMRSFTHLMPGEQQSCVGCHADRNYVTPNTSARPLAAMRPAEELTAPEWGVRGFSYPHIVQPVLDQHCVECHNAQVADGGVDLSGDKTDFFNVSYETLARQGDPGQNPYTKWIPTFNGQEANILQVTPKYWGSPASKLADLLLSGHPDETGQRRVHVDPQGERRVFMWIDLNVPYYGTSESNNNDLIGCRQMLPENLEQVLTEITTRRCAACHEPPRHEYVRITNVENNRFLLAPLARSAGGTERCGQGVFASKEDPDYQAILQTFESLHPLLAASPRADMVESADGAASTCPAAKDEQK